MFGKPGSVRDRAPAAQAGERVDRVQPASQPRPERGASWPCLQVWVVFPPFFQPLNLAGFVENALSLLSIPWVLPHPLRGRQPRGRRLPPGTRRGPRCAPSAQPRFHPPPPRPGPAWASGTPAAAAAFEPWRGP